MEYKTVTKKSPGGKLLRLKGRIQEKKVVSPQISGDFFLTPAEKIVCLEEAIEGFSVEALDELQELLDYVVEREHMTLTGITTKDIVEAVKEL